MAAIAPLDVMISSTCLDLIDARASLEKHLKAIGYEVRVSERAESGFCVSGKTDSISTCLANVEAVDAIVCLVDRRYGWPIAGGEYPDKSATHAEIAHARSKGKPIFYFIRDAALHDFDSLRRNPAERTDWVEPSDDANRRRWFEFVKEIHSDAPNLGRSNWRDTFATSADLCERVTHRLERAFPQQAAKLALRPDRLVRVTFTEVKSETNWAHYVLRNVGSGPAMQIRHGVTVTPTVPLHILRERRLGGLSEGQAANNNNAYPVNEYETGQALNACRLVCSYENRFGDNYLVESPLIDYRMPDRVPCENFYVRVGNSPGEWIRIS